MTKDELIALQAKPKKSKYKNKKCVIEGISFDSKKESVRYADLKLMERAGLISDLVLQPVFKIEINGQKICKYIADFEYIENDVHVVEDCKGFRTPVFNMKMKLMKAVHQIEIKLT